ncbi:hypothetical protein ANTRET_LOCUS6336 [Anthophora retusa]
MITIVLTSRYHSLQQRSVPEIIQPPLIHLRSMFPDRAERRRNERQKQKRKERREEERDRGGQPRLFALGTTRPVSKTRRAKPEGKGEEGEASP